MKVRILPRICVRVAQTVEALDATPTAFQLRIKRSLLLKTE